MEETNNHTIIRRTGLKRCYEELVDTKAEYYTEGVNLYIEAGVKVLRILDRYHKKYESVNKRGKTWFCIYGGYYPLIDAVQKHVREVRSSGQPIKDIDYSFVNFNDDKKENENEI